MDWFKKEKSRTPESNAGRPGGIDFETAARRVTAENPFAEAEEVATAAAIADIDEPGAAAEIESDDGELVIREEWAFVAIKGCFYPAAKWIHPAYALDDVEADKAAPEMQRFLQAVSNKVLPAAAARLANRYPEFTDLLSVLAVLYYRKWRLVSKLIAEEAKARAEAGENAKRVNVTVMPAPAAEEPEPRIVGERLKDGTLVI